MEEYVVAGLIVSGKDSRNPRCVAFHGWIYLHDDNLMAIISFSKAEAIPMARNCIAISSMIGMPKTVIVPNLSGETPARVTDSQDFSLRKLRFHRAI
jgi:hypothetical protein